MKTIILPYTSENQISGTLKNLESADMDLRILLVSSVASLDHSRYPVIFSSGAPGSTQWLKAIGNHVDCDDGTLFLYTKYSTLEPGYNALKRMEHVLHETGSGMVYADYRSVDVAGKLSPVPLLDLMEGSLRDDFDFGSLLAFDLSAFHKALASIESEYVGAGLYTLRLAMMRMSVITHIREFLYTDIENDNRKSGEKQFDYVNPRNRSIQLEMEDACTRHLKAIGAWLSPRTKEIDLEDEKFEIEASVIIPVKNRRKTIADAVDSVLRQEAPFRFNVIVVDNHSTDGTTEILARYTDERVIHVVPPRTDLGIGGCWNYGASLPQCGKFVLQLDSDDVYSHNEVIKHVVEKFYSEKCAMVIGSYLLTDFNLNELPPGKIDHKEWTDDNGPNNALRINGLGAPRCFYTPVLRRIKLPDVSYGEDYALALQICRRYKIGRIYDVLYYCRRWEDNSDASLDISKLNRNNHYKDSVRTQEIMARVLLNRSEINHG